MNIPQNAASPDSARPIGITVQRLGRTAYQDVWELQRQAQTALIEGRQGEQLILCEHAPTITVGKSSKDGHILVDDHTLRLRGVERFSVERGGDVTFHGPGQIVAYPIIDLRLRKRDVDWYMRLLEQTIIDTLTTFGLIGTRIKGKTGVWIGGTAPARERKIASLGVRISRWCTLHGLALNVGSVPGELSLEEGFAMINPCGLGDVEITSIQRELERSAGASRLLDPTQLQRAVAAQLEQHLLRLLSLKP